MKKLLVLAVALVLAASACSNGDGASVSISDDAADSPVESSESGDSVFDGDGGGDWCARAKVFDDSINVLDSDTPPSPAVIEAAYEEISSQFESIKQGAPPEIADAVATSVEGFQLIFDAFRAADFDFLNVDLATIELLDDPKYTEASDQVEAYLRDTCGIGDPDESSTVDEPSVDDSSGDDFELPTDGTVSDIIVESLMSAGFSQGEAECLANALGGDLLASSDDPNLIFQAFEECDIDLSRFAELEN
jgi:hypothetical protein